MKKKKSLLRLLHNFSNKAIMNPQNEQKIKAKKKINMIKIVSAFLAESITHCIGT